MRQLHPVGWKEVFVASGNYQPITGKDWVEYWTIHALDDDLQMVRVDSDHQASGNYFVLIEALRQRVGDAWHFQRVDMRLVTGAARHLAHDLSLVVEGDAVYMRRLIDGVLVYEDALSLAGEPVVLSAPSVLFGGFGADAATRHAAVRWLSGAFAPDQRGLTSRVSHVVARVADDVLVEIDDLALPARDLHVDITPLNSNTPPFSDQIRVDAHGVALMATTADAVLSQYVRRPETIR